MFTKGSFVGEIREASEPSMSVRGRHELIDCVRLPFHFAWEEQLVVLIESVIASIRCASQYGAGIDEIAMLSKDAQAILETTARSFSLDGHLVTMRLEFDVNFPTSLPV